MAVQHHKPSCWGEGYASAFQEGSVAAAYRHRPPYPASLFPLLAGLIAGAPRRVLDLGSGTGAIARHLLPFVDHVDAVDVSEAMIDEGKRLPHGDDPRLRWIVGRVEDAPLAPPYDLIIAGDSFHWFDWDAILPRCAKALAPSGVLAIVQLGQRSLPWDAELGDLIRRYSTNRRYEPIDMIAEIERRGLFRQHGALCTLPVLFTQSVDHYVESFHGRASFSRERMTFGDVSAFDQAIRDLVGSYGHQSVELALVAEVVWGMPLMPDQTRTGDQL